MPEKTGIPRLSLSSRQKEKFRGLRKTVVPAMMRKYNLGKCCAMLRLLRQLHMYLLLYLHHPGKVEQTSELYVLVCARFTGKTKLPHYGKLILPVLCGRACVSGREFVAKPCI